jgi:hypothetical protein
MLLSAGAPIDAELQCGWTPLALAVECGQVDIGRFLIRAGADVSGLTGDCYTLLALACAFSSVGMVMVLLRAGADPGQRDGNGLTALHYAVSRGSVEIVRALLSHDEWVAEPADVWTPRIGVFRVRSDGEIGRLLIEAGGYGMGEVEVVFWDW